MGEQVDVFVVGGGPAGLAAAIAARKQNLRVTGADGSHFPIEKACGEGLLPRTVEILRELGVSIEASDGKKFHGIRFIDGAQRVQADFPASTGIGMPRKRLHEILVDAATSAG